MAEAFGPSEAPWKWAAACAWPLFNVVYTRRMCASPSSSVSKTTEYELEKPPVPEFGASAKADDCTSNEKRPEGSTRMQTRRRLSSSTGKLREDIVRSRSVGVQAERISLALETHSSNMELKRVYAVDRKCDSQSSGLNARLAWPDQ